MIVPSIPAAAAAFRIAQTFAGYGSSSQTCIVDKAAGIDADDTPNIVKAFDACKANATVIFSEGVTYNTYTPFQVTGLSNVKIEINGNIQLSSNLTYVEQQVKKLTTATSLYGKSWIFFEGSQVSVHGSTDPNWGWFEGYGEQWWGNPQSAYRPRLATFKVNDGYLVNLKHHKMIAWSWLCPGNNILVENHYSDNKPTSISRQDTQGFPFNTDGINVSGQNFTLNGYFGYNGDDAVSIVGGAKNIHVSNVYAGFSSHGMSIGSLGKGGSVDIVENVLVENVVMEGAVYGARFKSWTGGNGYARNVTFRNFTLIDVSTAIFVTQNYYDQGVGKPNVTSTNSTAISDFHFENFRGTLAANWTDGSCVSNPCWNYVSGIEAGDGIILDLYNRTATDITFCDIHVVPAGYGMTEADTKVVCNATVFDGTDLADLGFICHNGLLREVASCTPNTATTNYVAPFVTTTTSFATTAGYVAPAATNLYSSARGLHIVGVFAVVLAMTL
ncbi:hypothetical protein HDU84_007699 [Entophlyctis sp. JEL0112]|nr:hypothetical protein HDU84_007699 [Entophlyctis sp. JEL0112]